MCGSFSFSNFMMLYALPLRDAMYGWIKNVFNTKSEIARDGCGTSAASATVILILIIQLKEKAEVNYNDITFTTFALGNLEALFLHVDFY